jgi:hypothetical protein
MALMQTLSRKLTEPRAERKRNLADELLRKGIVGAAAGFCRKFVDCGDKPAFVRASFETA